ncbi:histidine phosphatase superfamily [Pelagophyceae sp. CCMP2097]|nr:histidine phosphatase superfamily [Pelagophyceae sp. CCMP2097]|mmetsp:Transcript_3429/g.10409  ORF Transcript_3429/g.10409 Transcript_3429/m.10409 type:complete len:347 (+) Transcript_3429:37-1077(+)
MELLPALTTALLSASLVSLVLLDATSIHLVVQKLQLYAYGWLLMVLGRDKRWRALKLKRAMLHRMEGVTSKRLILMRHGESEWNLIFNVGSKLLVPFKATVALWREAKMLLHLDMGSVLYDSPLNEAGLEQAQEIAELLRDEVVTSGDVAILRGSPGALTSVLATSNLRRAAQTVAVALQDRLARAACGSPDRVHVLSSLQEISTNVDTISITEPFVAPVLPRVAEMLQSPTLFDSSANFGNKRLRGNGLERILSFCRWTFERDEACVIVGGHSLWFLAFFRELLPVDEWHESKDSKVANGGIVSCILDQGYIDGQLIYAIRPETIVAVHKGFDVKKKRKTKSKTN